MIYYQYSELYVIWLFYAYTLSVVPEMMARFFILHGNVVEKINTMTQSQVIVPIRKCKLAICNAV